MKVGAIAAVGCVVSIFAASFPSGVAFADDSKRRDDEILMLSSELSSPTECTRHYDGIQARGASGPAVNGAMDAACRHASGFGDAYHEVVRASSAAGSPAPTAADLCGGFQLPACGPQSVPACKDLETKLEDARAKCAPRTKTSAGGAGAILVAAVGGLGDFLKERAKEELIAYAVRVLGSEVCVPGRDLHAFLTISWEDKTRTFAFEQSCKVAFPNGKDLDYAAFADGRFQKVFKADAENLPTFLIQKATHEIVCKADTKDRTACAEAAVWGDISVGLLRYLTPLLHGGRVRKQTVFRDLDKSIKGEAGGSTACSAKSFGPACGALLAVRFGAVVEEEFVGGVGGILDPAALVRKATASFCADYGAKGEESSCIPDVELMTAVAGDIRDAIELLRGARDEQDSAAARSQVVDAMRLLFGAALRVARARAGTDQKTLSVIDCLSAGADAALALANKDLQGSIVSIKLVVTSLFVAAPELKEALGPTGVRALMFALDLGAAKDAADAKKIIEGAAEPLGSYRSKYDASFVLALNGYVGPSIGGTFPLNRAANTPKAELDPRPLAGPVGLDFSFRAGKQHFGFMVKAIDPLGMVVIEEDGESHVDWGRVLTPGLMLRWGIAESPLVLFGGAHYEPLRRPDEIADPSSPAFKGAFAAGGGVAIDIPILIFTAQ